MIWKSIRLELAYTREFPRGSASRSYLLRLPLRADGCVDEPTVRSDPAHATARRFWPSEPDIVGYIIPAPGGWKFGFEPGEEADDILFDLGSGPLRIGAEVTVTERHGRRLPFKVASLRELQ